MNITKLSLWNREHYKIELSNVTYFYDLAGGGFSKMLDADGVDWIDFNPEPLGEFPTSANSGFRGMPNLVHDCDDGGTGHPGFNKCPITSDK